MLNREILRRLIPSFIYFLLITAISWPIQLAWIFFLLGLILGNFILDLDQFIYCYFQAPHEFSSQRLKRFLSLNRFRESLIYTFQTAHERQRTVFHSAFFQVVFLIAVLFVLTSSGSLLGKGLVMGLFLQMLVVQGRELRVEGKMDRWFWNFKSIPTPQIQFFFFLVMCLLFLGMSLGV
ncbi:MAG: hypothetical protein Q8Q15_02875 [bacterium]|nr:hypothetical protein [bacterium]